MVEIKAFSQYPELLQPRRVMKYVLIWCSKGKLTVVADQMELELTQHQVLTITSGQVHFLKKMEAAEGWVLEFTLDFFCKDDNDIELIFHNGLFCHFDMNEVITVPNDELMEQNLQSIARELAAQTYQYLLAVHAYIKLMLVEINRAKVNQGDEIYKPDALFLKFLELVRVNFEHNYPLSYYAEKLGTTEAKLNEQAKQHAGKTAQHVMNGLITSEAKRLLTYHNLPVKEVAYQLGFNDPFYFSNFFKKHTGLSPKAYHGQYAL